MSNNEQLGHSIGDFSISDVLGDNYPSPIEIADRMSEAEISDTLAQHTESILDTEQKIAELQSLKQRQMNERLVYISALLIARDKNLE